jgi:hypothetical protein
MQIRQRLTQKVSMRDCWLTHKSDEAETADSVLCAIERVLVVGRPELEAGAIRILMQMGRWNPGILARRVMRRVIEFISCDLAKSSLRFTAKSVLLRFGRDRFHS